MPKRRGIFRQPRQDLELYTSISETNFSFDSLTKVSNYERSSFSICDLPTFPAVERLKTVTHWLYKHDLIGNNKHSKKFSNNNNNNKISATQNLSLLRTSNFKKRAKMRRRRSLIVEHLKRMVIVQESSDNLVKLVEEPLFLKRDMKLDRTEVVSKRKISEVKSCVTKDYSEVFKPKENFFDKKFQADNASSFFEIPAGSDDNKLTSQENYFNTTTTTTIQTSSAIFLKIGNNDAYIKIPSTKNKKSLLQVVHNSNQKKATSSTIEKHNSALNSHYCDDEKIKLNSVGTSEILQEEIGSARKEFKNEVCKDGDVFGSDREILRKIANLKSYLDNIFEPTPKYIGDNENGKKLGDAISDNKFQAKFENNINGMLKNSSNNNESNREKDVKNAESGGDFDFKLANSHSDVSSNISQQTSKKPATTQKYRREEVQIKRMESKHFGVFKVNSKLRSKIKKIIRKRRCKPKFRKKSTKIKNKNSWIKSPIRQLPPTHKKLQPSKFFPNKSDSCILHKTCKNNWEVLSSAVTMDGKIDESDLELEPEVSIIDGSQQNHETLESILEKFNNYPSSIIGSKAGDGPDLSLIKRRLPCKSDSDYFMLLKPFCQFEPDINIEKSYDVQVLTQVQNRESQKTFRSKLPVRKNGKDFEEKFLLHTKLIYFTIEKATQTPTFETGGKKSFYSVESGKLSSLRKSSKDVDVADSGTQMYDYITAGELYCRNWVQKYLFNIEDVNPFTTVLDSKLESGSTKSCMTSKQSDTDSLYLDKPRSIRLYKKNTH